MPGRAAQVAAQRLDQTLGDSQLIDKPAWDTISEIWVNYVQWFVCVIIYF